MILETSFERELYCENIEMVDKKNYNIQGMYEVRYN